MKAIGNLAVGSYYVDRYGNTCKVLTHYESNDKEESMTLVYKIEEEETELVFSESSVITITEEDAYTYTENGTIDMRIYNRDFRLFLELYYNVNAVIFQRWLWLKGYKVWYRPTTEDEAARGLIHGYNIYNTKGKLIRKGQDIWTIIRNGEPIPNI